MIIPGHLNPDFPIGTPPAAAHAVAEVVAADFGPSAVAPSVTYPRQPISHHIGHVRAALELLHDAEASADAAARVLSTVPHFADEWQTLCNLTRQIDARRDALFTALELKEALLA